MLIQPIYCRSGLFEQFVDFGSSVLVFFIHQIRVCNDNYNFASSGRGFFFKILGSLINCLTDTGEITIPIGRILKTLEPKGAGEAAPVFKLSGDNIRIFCERLSENDIVNPGHQRDLGVLAESSQSLTTSPQLIFGHTPSVAIPSLNENDDRERLSFLDQTDLLLFAIFA